METKIPPLREWEAQFEQIAAEQACGLKTSIISDQMHDMFSVWNGSKTNMLCCVCGKYKPGILGMFSEIDLHDDEDPCWYYWCRCSFDVNLSEWFPSRAHYFSSPSIPTRLLEINVIVIMSNSVFCFVCGMSQVHRYRYIIEKCWPNCKYEHGLSCLEIYTRQLPLMVAWLCQKNVEIAKSLKSAISSVMRCVLPKDCVFHLMQFVPFL